MRTNDLIQVVNNLLSGELLSYADMAHLLDATIDDINNQCSTKFPTFTELKDANNGAVATEYTAFPDRYLRTVVAKGAAAKFYTEDEEGIQTAQTYQQEYQEALFYMLRDYADTCEEEVQDFNKGSITCGTDDFYGGGEFSDGTIWSL